jgi:hypothetical protein
MSSAQTDCEQLLSALMPFVSQMLSEHGEFYPVGAVMTPDGECQLAAVADDVDDDQPDPSFLIELFETQFSEGAKSGDHKATAIVYDALTVPPEKSEKQDTIICLLDHRDNFSAKVCFPYTVEDGEVDLEDPFAVEGDYKVFGKK